MSHDQRLERPFLDTLKAEEVPVSIYLVNGIKLQGKIEAFDDHVVMLKNSFSQIIFKHAISTVVPMRKVLLEGFESEGAHEVIGDESAATAKAQQGEPTV